VSLLIFSLHRYSSREAGSEIDPTVVIIACSDYKCLHFVNKTYANQYAWTNVSVDDMLTVSSHMIHHDQVESPTTIDMGIQWMGLTPRIHPNLQTSLMNMMLMDENLIDTDVQVLGFVDLSQPEQSFSTIIDDSCPGMVQILTQVLLAMKEDPEKIESMNLPYPGFQTFHGEFFVARPSIVRSYVSWLTSVIHRIESMSQENKRIVPACISSHTHMLASYYFNSNMARIVTDKGYKKILDEKISLGSKKLNTRSLNIMKQ
jgi:hypothetical protein